MSTPVLGNLKKGKVFVVSAPAGTGKTTLVKMLENEFPCVLQSISYTTRAPRKNEVEDVDYHFISREDFEKRIEKHQFLEYVQLYGDYYGTAKTWVSDHQRKGKHVVLVIDTQGALQLMGHFEATFIFIAPPSLEVLRKRLDGRKTETPEALEKRLAIASKEMKEAKHYQYKIVNDNLQIAYAVLRSILIAEEHKVKAKEVG